MELGQISKNKDRRISTIIGSFHFTDVSGCKWNRTMSVALVLSLVPVS